MTERVVTLRPVELSHRWRWPFVIEPVEVSLGRWRLTDHGYLRLRPWLIVAVPGVIAHICAWAAIVGAVSVFGWSGISIDGGIVAGLILVVTGAAWILPVALGIVRSSCARVIDIDSGSCTVTIMDHGRTGLEVVPVGQVNVGPCVIDLVSRTTVTYYGIVLVYGNMTVLLCASREMCLRDEYLRELLRHVKGLGRQVPSAIIVKPTLV